MQPLQCVLQHPVANLHLSTHAATSDDDNHASHSNAICNQRCKNRIELRTQTQPLVAKHIEGTDRDRNDPSPSRTRRTHEVLYTEKHKVSFVLRLPPQNIAHATFMQPLQCILQHPVANLHLSTHVATSDDDNHAVIPMLFATRDARTA